ncbi:rCG36868 [Rattus norvegicus]|uniref:RCG36868 n=1 Tax=Rattus norvegicus TaxID=10116 RepID=A6HUF4_RAT|nr:rCG36868 [Rattus norvegicus]
MCECFSKVSCLVKVHNGIKPWHRIFNIMMSV